MRKIELLFLVIGLLLGICIIFFVGAVGKSAGRFEFHSVKVYSSFMGKEPYVTGEVFYILDTETGNAVGYNPSVVSSYLIDFQKDYQERISK